jgi:hypothetical protein
MDLSTKILSDITVHMKYSKYIPELHRRETWNELVTRNKNMHQKKYPNIADEIEKAYQYVYDKKVLPSMRSLQFGGKPTELRTRQETDESTWLYQRSTTVDLRARRLADPRPHDSLTGQACRAGTN